MLEALMVEACLIRVSLTLIILPCCVAADQSFDLYYRFLCPFLVHCFPTFSSFCREAFSFPTPCFPGVVSTWTNTLSDFNDVCGHGLGM
ncbi:uncharacterized protein BO80DRAFT_186820 [Aspergillus ibericus CBS 121593]|uniref:Secreted protein n=1 Tax=Aspergillus ibericus CBS 121593 TaxID=1448316 RepID=A0A395GQN1_9EURO|nr:hypothetical protein BO80DRAFT_186820 [Aspergillus ibericus CBS 121593]RAK97594.1 hypothetical protein BO80DRAFT_186820 [Aspergillus ibericus CBS 121593]